MMTVDVALLVCIILRRGGGHMHRQNKGKDCSLQDEILQQLEGPQLSPLPHLILTESKGSISILKNTEIIGV